VLKFSGSRSVPLQDAKVGLLLPEPTSGIFLVGRSRVAKPLGYELRTRDSPVSA
jgi:hypothetical protein